MAARSPRVGARQRLRLQRLRRHRTAGGRRRLQWLQLARGPLRTRKQRLAQPHVSIRASRASPRRSRSAPRRRPLQNGAARPRTRARKRRASATFGRHAKRESRARPARDLEWLKRRAQRGGAQELDHQKEPGGQFVQHGWSVRAEWSQPAHCRARAHNEFATIWRRASDSCGNWPFATKSERGRLLRWRCDHA
jgi:hypothetical protein